MSRSTKSTLVIIAFATIFIGQSGCGKKISLSEKKTFAKLYADLLMVQTNWTNDSVRQAKAIDSILKGTAFANVEEVKKWLEETTVRDPEGLREMLDSTQKNLERFRSDPTTSPHQTVPPQG